MTQPQPSLIERIGAFLNRLEEVAEGTQAPPPAEPEPGLSAQVGAQVARYTEVIDVLAQLVDRLKERMALLQMACQDAGLLPPRAVVLHPRLALQRDAYVTLMKQDAAAARLTAPAVLRYYEASDDLDRLRTSLGAGRIEGINLDAIRGKYMFLSKIQLYFKDHPLLAALFKPRAQAAPATAGLVAPASPLPITPTATSTSLALPGGPPPLPRQPRSGLTGATRGPDTVSLGSRPRGTQALPKPASPPTGPRHLLDKLELRMLILRAAVEPLPSLQDKSQALLPPPARETARALSAALEQAPAVRDKARQYVRIYAEARRLLDQRSDMVRLRELCTQLSAMPRHLAGNPVLDQLFAA